MNKRWILALTAVALLGISCAEQQSEEEQVAPAPVEEMPDVTAELYDHGANPFVVNVEALTLQNETFRTAVWTGEYLQLTVMSIPVGGEIGLEVHNTIEQFLRIEEGKGLMMMGDSAEELTLQKEVSDDDVILVPKGKWHNVKNIGDIPLKVYSIYANPEHPHGTVHKTAEEAATAHHEHEH